MVTAKDPRNPLYSHLQNKDAEYWVERLVKCPRQVGKEKIKYTPYERVGKYLSATYLVFKRDKDLTIEVQDQMASLLGKECTLEYVDSGHCAQIGSQAEISEIVKRSWEASKAKLLKE